LGDFLKLEALLAFDLACNFLEDFMSLSVVGQGDVEMLLDTARTEDGFIDDVWPISGCNDIDHPAIVNSAQLIQKGIDHSLCYLVALILTLRGKGIELIEEDNAGRRLPCPLKDLPNCLLTLTHILSQQFRTFDSDEVRIGFIGNCLGNHGLPASWRAIQQNTSSIDLEIHVREFLSLLHRQDDLLDELQLDTLKSPDVFQLHRWDLCKTVLFEDWLDLHKGVSHVLQSDQSLRSSLCLLFGGLDLAGNSIHASDCSFLEETNDIDSDISSSEQSKFLQVILKLMIVHSDNFLYNFASLGLIGIVDLDLLVEHAWFGERVHLLRSGCGSKDVDLLVFDLVDVVVKGQGGEGLHAFVVIFVAELLEVVDEDDRGDFLLCGLEELLELLLGVSGEEVKGVYGESVELLGLEFAQVGEDAICQEGLA
jgi:hypothetical protein